MTKFYVITRCKIALIEGTVSHDCFSWLFVKHLSLVTASPSSMGPQKLFNPPVYITFSSQNMSAASLTRQKLLQRDP
jgi:hypothetical protein